MNETVDEWLAFLEGLNRARVRVRLMSGLTNLRTPASDQTRCAAGGHLHSTFISGPDSHVRADGNRCVWIWVGLGSG